MNSRLVVLFLFFVPSFANLPVGTIGQLHLQQDDFAHEVFVGMFALGDSYGTSQPYISATIKADKVFPEADGYFAFFIKSDADTPQPCSPCLVNGSSACLPVSGDFGDQNSVTISLDVKSTGLYWVSVKRCGRGLDSANFTVDYEFRNPYGYLRGEEFYFYPYYACLSLVYMIFGMLWAKQACSNWSEIIPLQKWLAAVLIIGAIESVTWFLVYSIENTTGVPHTGAYIIAMIFSTIKRTVSYQLILSVCLGWGIVHKNLKEVTSIKLAVLGVAYMIVYGLFAIMEELPVNISVFVLPVALLDSIYFYWMYIGLSRTKAFLSLKQQHAEKLNVYTQFYHVMIIVAVLSFVVLVASAFTGPQSWEAEWLLLFPNTAFWDGVFTMLAVTIALYWAPRQGSSRYLPTEENEGESLEKRVADVPVTAFVINDDDFENMQSKMH